MHKDHEACPHDELKAAIDHLKGLVPGEKDFFLIFFSRVRTPCGHGAQVIIEGREIQSDGGEKDKENPTTNQANQTTANQSPQAESPPSCSLSSVLR